MILYILLSLAILLLIYMNIEARLVKLEHIRFTRNKKNLKVMQISDIHINHLMVPTKKIQKIIRDNKPDFIILTGDYISKDKHVPDFLRLLEKIKDGNTVYACLGNHEYKAFENNQAELDEFVGKMEALGIVVLNDSSVIFTKNSRKYNIIGLINNNNRSDDTDAAMNMIDPEANTCIAISHNPDIIYKFGDNRADYLFCGHFHGGQIWAPFDIEFRVLRNEKLCKIGITRGLHKINGIKLYISRGLGSICFPFRFMSRPEITLFYIP